MSTKELATELPAWLSDCSIPVELRGFEHWRRVQALTIPLFIEILRGHERFLPDDENWISIAQTFNSNPLFVTDFGWLQLAEVGPSSFTVHTGHFVDARRHDFAEVVRFITAIAQQAQVRFIYATMPEHSKLALKAAVKSGFTVSAKFDRDRSFGGELRDMFIMRLEVSED